MTDETNTATEPLDVAPPPVEPVVDDAALVTLFNEALVADDLAQAAKAREDEVRSAATTKINEAEGETTTAVNTANATWHSFAERLKARGDKSPSATFKALFGGLATLFVLVLGLAAGCSHRAPSSQDPVVVGDLEDVKAELNCIAYNLGVKIDRVEASVKACRGETCRTLNLAKLAAAAKFSGLNAKLDGMEERYQPCCCPPKVCVDPPKPAIAKPPAKPQSSPRRRVCYKPIGLATTQPIASARLLPPGFWNRGPARRKLANAWQRFIDDFRRPPQRRQ